MNKQDTEVTKWLLRHDAAEFVDAFFEEGYYELIDLDEDAIHDCIPDSKSGFRRRLLRTLQDSKVPNLKPGTPIDLSPFTLYDADHKAFTLPEYVPTLPDVISPTDVGMTDWMRIAQNSNILFGYDMSRNESIQADKAVLYWKVPAHRDSFMQSRQLEAKIGSSLVYTERSSKYIKEGFTKASVTATIPCCTASFSYEHQEKMSRSSYHKSLHMLGWYHYPRVKLHLKECTVVSPEFVSTVQKALDMPEKKRAKALEEVFETYGHIVGWEVVLGGRLYLEKTKDEDGHVEEHQQEDTIKAAVGFKYGGASFEHGTKEANTEEAHQIAEEGTFEVRGGDTTLADDPKAWATSIKNPMLWAMISHDEVMYTVDLLDETLRAQVLEVLQLPTEHPWANKTVSFACNDPSCEHLGLSWGLAALDMGLPGYANKIQYGESPECVSGLEDSKLLNDKRQKQRLIWHLEFYKYDETDGAPLFWITNTANENLLGYGPYTFTFFGHDHELIPAVHTYYPGKMADPALKAKPMSDEGRRCLWKITPVDFTQNHKSNNIDGIVTIENFDNHQYLTAWYWVVENNVLGGHIINVEVSSPDKPRAQWTMQERSI